jgi:four helix bundle protein
MELAVEIFQETKVWPAEEKFSLTDQIRRSSRSVTAQLAEGWRKRRYQAAFVSKLNDSEGEAAETQNWIEHAVRCGYLDRERGLDLHGRYNHVLGKLVTMQNKPEPWLLQARRE